MAVFLGIDFGACNLKAAKWDGRKIAALRLNNTISGSYEAPNVILYDKNNDGSIENKIGFPAKRSLDEANKISYLKRKLEIPAWSKVIPHLGRKITAAEAAKDIFSEANAIIIDKDKARSKGAPAAITVPVCFSAVQRNRIQKAAEKAGIAVRGILTESFAALFSQEDILDEDDPQIVLIFDFGGSTLDTSLVKVEKDDDLLKVTEIASAGLHYGGLDIDRSIYDFMETKYPAAFSEIFSDENNVGEKNRLLELFREMKEELFADEEEEISRTYTSPQGKDYDFDISTEEVLSVFEKEQVKERINNLLDGLFDQTENTLPKDVTLVKPFGGTCHIHYFLEILEAYFGNEIFDSSDYDADEVGDLYTAVAQGAARWLMLKETDGDVEIHDCIPYHVGILSTGNRFKSLITKNAVVMRKSRLMTLSTEDLKKNGYAISLFQQFEFNFNGNREEMPAPVFMGLVKLTKEKYNGIPFISYQLGLDGRNNPYMETYTWNEDEKVLIEKQPLEVGGDHGEE